MSLSLLKHITLTLCALAGGAELVAREVPARPAADSGKLKVSILDDTGRPTPARVELLGKDGTAYIADDALLIGGDAGKGTWNLENSPAVSLEQALAHFATKKVMNGYTQTEQFYADGKFQFSLPAGDYTLRIFKGLEYRIATRRPRVDPSCCRPPAGSIFRTARRRLGRAKGFRMRCRNLRGCA